MDDKAARAWRKSYGLPETLVRLNERAYVIERRNAVIRAQLDRERGTYPRALDHLPMRTDQDAD